ncbi:hypothetical protein SmJEL517_g00952 [Synchytrium microbalum]|uniref:Uncharacterized protein n=1 Tax=Synchytrium microbalum TaxID=1806994 RepID=A0A507CC95_9FUNG|nr:uncharacterized protein SmJEL517_g00952 [Synchytrium microbalum]TPX36958.1 hypothetical protein SmJEL517_g00952 [Synchytrium microbalum]
MLAPQPSELPVWTPTVIVPRCRVTPDGGIVKMQNLTTASEQFPVWERGSNAKIAYTAYTFIPHDLESTPNDPSSPSPVAKHECHQHNSSSDKICCSNHENEHKHDCSSSHGKCHQEPDIIPLPITEQSKPKRVKVGESSVFELRMGMKFSVPAMEECIKTMRVGETAKFLCLPPYTDGYVQMELALRQERDKSVGSAPRCAHGFASLLNQHKDLIHVPTTPLEFEITLIDAKSPKDFERELWEMSSLEKWNEAVAKRVSAKELCQAGRWNEALPILKRSVILLESLKTSSTIQDLEREKLRQDRLSESTDSATTELDFVTLEDYNELYISTHLNHALCTLKLGDYESSILSCTAVITRDPNHVKARFRRAKAYIAIGRDLELAEQDIYVLKHTLQDTDDTLADIRREETLLRQKKLAWAAKERNMYAGILTK